MSTWSFGRKHGIKGDWPQDENGYPVPPAMLIHVPDKDMEAEMTCNMLLSFGIPTVCTYPNGGDFGTVIMGTSGPGVDIFVPETLLDDARNILSADIQYDTEEENQT